MESMQGAVGHALAVFMGFFAIMNPLANTPVFLGLTANDTPEQRKRVAIKALVTTFLIITVFTLLGKGIFDLFGITLPAFRITGGILVGLIGYQMLQGSSSGVHQPNSGDGESDMESALSVAITPLAVPILGGPGTIATAMNYASAGGAMEMIVTLAAFALLCVISYLSFIFGDRLVKFLGTDGLSVVTRLMGLILAVMGVQMVISGVSGAIKMAG